MSTDPETKYEFPYDSDFYDRVYQAIQTFATANPNTNVGERFFNEALFVRHMALLEPLHAVYNTWLLDLLDFLPAEIANPLFAPPVAAPVPPPVKRRKRNEGTTQRRKKAAQATSFIESVLQEAPSIL
jgi:hypothetical protein